MCGIVSVIKKDWSTTLNFSAEKAFKQMLFADALRGGDGTGMFWKDDKQNRVFYDKVPKASWEAIPLLKNLDKLAGVAQWVVGHNRKATMGVHTTANTHPFHEDHIVLVHNGTLSNLWELEKEIGNCDVDSQAIAKLLAKQKPKQALEKLEGAYALVWYNTNESKLYFARNKERPLWIVESELYYFIVSEAELALWIAARNDIITTKVTEVPVGKIYSLMVSKANKLHTNVVNFTPKEKKITYHVPQQSYYPYNPPQQSQQVLPYMRMPGAEKWFVIGDTVTFSFVSSYVVNGVKKIRGKTVDAPVLQVESTVTKDSQTLYEYGTILEGTVAKVEYTFGNHVINCINVEPQVSAYKSDNGLMITDRILNQLECKQCEACAASPLTDYDHAHVYYNANSKEHEFLCPNCNKLNLPSYDKHFAM